MRVSIRDYRPQDFRTLWQIDQSCFPPGIAYTQFQLRTMIQHWGAFTLVAESEEDRSVPSILGFIVAESSRRLGHIITIDVRSEARRHRIGSSLLDRAESCLRTAKCHAVRLETAVDNLTALAFYKRHGYAVIDTLPRYYANGVNALLLEKLFVVSKS